jgi:predicted NAD-dependent protein-ADP-ribosyltransferase YbiA (DUF1768 family)
VAKSDPQRSSKKSLTKSSNPPLPRIKLDIETILRQLQELATELEELAVEADVAQLIEQAEQVTTTLKEGLVIRGFRGPYHFLSNAHPALIIDGLTYPSVEHAIQAGKSDDLLYKVLVRDCGSVANARKIGRGAPSKGPSRSMVMGYLRQKFSNKELRAKLLATAPALLIEEDNWGDTFWGTKDGEGMNHLGQLLMELRDDLWEEFWNDNLGGSTDQGTQERPETVES